MDDAKKGHPPAMHDQLKLSRIRPFNRTLAINAVAPALSVTHTTLMLLLALCGSLFAAGVELHVAPDGSDTLGDGGMLAPFATPARARDILRGMPETQANGAQVWLHGGIYRLDQSLVLDDRDSGGEGCPVVYAAWPGEEVVISGGLPVTQWTPTAFKSNILWTAVAVETQARDFFIGHRRAVRARTTAGLGTGLIATESGLLTSSTNPLSWPTNGVELCMKAYFRDPRLLIDDIRLEGTNVFLKLQQPAFDYVNETVFSNRPPSSAVKYAENALSFLDTAGEWFLDKQAGRLYYWPLPEDGASPTGVLGRCETLLSIRGPDVERFATDITFRGITFAESTWLRPATASHVSVQSNLIREWLPRENLENGKYPTTLLCGAAVDIGFAARIRFERCTFTRLGAAAINAYQGTHGLTIAGCAFSELGGGALQIGEPNESDRNNLNPIDLRYKVRDISISDNWIQNIGQVYESSSAVFIGFVDGADVLHNEIRDVPHMGVALGWGWAWELFHAGQNCQIIGNRIVNCMQQPDLFDGGAIYAMNSQPGSVVASNSIASQLMNYGALYADIGAAGIRFEANVIADVPRWVFAHSPLTERNAFVGNYLDDTRMYHYSIETAFASNHLHQAGVWPEPALDIIGASGIREAWRRSDLPPFADIVSPLSKAQIESGKPCVMAARVTYPSNGIERVRFSVNGVATGTVAVCQKGLYRWSWIPEGDGPVNIQAIADLSDGRSIASRNIDTMVVTAARRTAVVTSGASVAFEAEDWARQYTRRDKLHTWRTVTLPNGYSGSGAIQVLPDEGWSSPTEFIEWLPRVDYYLSVPSPVYYYLWLRGRGASTASDRLYVAINGRLMAVPVSLPAGSAWSWVSADVNGNRLVLDLHREGLHTLSAIMTRDGVALDQFYLTRNENDVPTSAVTTTATRIDVSDRPVLSLTATQARAYEVPRLDGSLTVWRQDRHDASLIADLEVTGTATWANDFLPFATNAVLAPDDSALTIPIRPVRDDLPEATEMIVVSLSPKDDYVIGFPGTAGIEIMDPSASEAGEWRRTHFGNYYATDAADDQDPDDDGLSNLIEEAIGTDPTRADDGKQTRLPVLALEPSGESSKLHLRYQRPGPAIETFEYEIEYTTDLANPDWKPSVPIWTGMDGGGGTQGRIIHQIYDLENEQLFFRTRIRRR